MLIVDRRKHAVQKGGENLFLGGEVVIHRRFGDSNAIADLSDRRLVVANLCHEFVHCIQYFLFCAHVTPLNY